MLQISPTIMARIILMIEIFSVVKSCGEKIAATHYGYTASSRKIPKNNIKTL